MEDILVVVAITVEDTPVVVAVTAAAGEAMVGVEVVMESNARTLRENSLIPMKFSNRTTRLGSFLSIVFLALTWGILPSVPLAAETNDVPESFASPELAITSLRAAVATDDRAALHKLFGSEFEELLTGDAVQDANNIKRFAAAMAQRCRPVKEGNDKITLEVGANHWPMPIPLVQADGQWHFDTAAGKEEVINRHIGKDELLAIGACRAYVAAQRKYARTRPEGGTEVIYAQHFKSAPGKKDGLYWPAASGESASPFGPLVADAQAQGYVVHKRGTGPHPFHGYYFKILTRQGEAALGGKKDYMDHGKLTGGFALVAFPEHWGRSGIMTFIVNQDGKVFQQDLGEDTAQVAGALTEFNPDSDWKLVEDEGVLRAASEK